MRDKTLMLSGTVKELHWTNPHVAIFIENTGSEGERQWDFGSSN